MSHTFIKEHISHNPGVNMRSRSETYRTRARTRAGYSPNTAALLTFTSMGEIRKIAKRTVFMVVAVGFFLSACNNAGEQKKTPSLPPAPPHATLGEYKDYLGKLDTTVVGSASLAAGQFQKWFNTKDTLRNDSAYCFFEQYYYRLCRTLNENSIFDTILVSGLDSISLDSPGKYIPELAAPFAELRRNGFQLDQVEDFIAIVPDDDFVMKNFYPYVSTSMRKYLDKVKQENEDGTEENGSLIISAREVADRALWWEWFSNTYPAFALSDNAREYRQYYLTCLLRGLDNTPVLQPGTKIADTNFLRAYQYVLDKHANTRTAKLIGPYYEAIMDNKRFLLDTILIRYRTQDIILW